MDAQHAGRGYLALPDSGEGPGVLVLHSWWGLNAAFRDVCDRLAAEALGEAPDLTRWGRHAPTADDAAVPQRLSRWTTVQRPSGWSRTAKATWL